MIFDPLLDLLRGKAVTIPPMDGAFRPNTALDDAAPAVALPAPDHLAVDGGGRLLVSSGNTVFAVAGTALETVSAFDAPVTALAVSPAGELTVALETGGLTIGGRAADLPAAVGCITAMAYAPDGALVLANGSAERKPSEWVADLMEKRASGSLWRREAAGGPFRSIADGLAFPFGVQPDGDTLVVSESWRHRLLRIDPGSGRRAVLVGLLPGYPARLSPAAGGGAWLAVFAPRNRLVEFVLQEEAYRRDMLDQVAPDHWIAPALSSGRSFLEPLQCGGIRTMGVHKPWSPSRSYGMVVRLDRDWRPACSLHSRADGSRHGITSAVEHEGRLVAASKGGDCLVCVDPGGRH